jgi:hypothetical protein
MKISANILSNTTLALPRKFESACLRRDDYLAMVIELEIEHLAAEVPEPNSDQARAFIKQSLNDERLERRWMSIQLPGPLVKNLDETCKNKNIPRDAFLNRLLFMLAAAPKTIDQIFFADFADWRTEVWSEGKHEGPFFENVFYPLEQKIDPFWAIRYGLELKKLRWKNRTWNFYTTQLDDSLGVNLYGLNCHLSDRSIPGSPEKKKFLAELDALLGR